MNEGTFLPSNDLQNSPLICEICGDVARGLNFNVVTCVSCKVFFRRNAYRQQSIRQCLSKKDCDVQKGTRGLCSACRLEKCFQTGMDPLLIRRIPTQPRKDKRKSTIDIFAKIPFKLAKPQTLNLLRNDRSMLTTDQWNLISNMIHLYDDLHPIKQIQYLIEELTYLPPKLREKPTGISALVNKFYSNVRPLVQRCKDFNNLSTDVCHTLMKNNTSLVGCLNALFLYREFSFSKYPFIKSASLSLYGDEITNKSDQQVELFDPNGNLIKILMLILCFSSNTSVVQFDPTENYQSFSNSIGGIDTQNFYITVFWKYLLYLYGFEQAVLRFSSLIKRIVDLIYLVGLLSEHQAFNQMLRNVVSSLNQSLMIGDK